MSWYKKSKVFLEGVKLLNKLPSADLSEIISEIVKNGLALSDYNENKHSTPLNFTEDEGTLVHKTILYLVNRFNLFLLTPTSLQRDLKELGLDDEKTDLLLKYYCDISKDIVKDLAPNIESSPADDVISYDLKTAYASDTLGRTKHPVARLFMKINGQSVDMEMRREDVSQMFESLELIQSELDDLSSRK
ncbi:unnamed protein product [Diamesa serratosioi]